jgi:N-sulfoglucosamine sulfohydrolase
MMAGSRRAGLVVSATLLIGAGFAAESRADDRPHIVLYLSDDHGQEFAGCYGNRAIKTPNLDSLAREGTRFTGVFSASPTCSPSRAALFTSLYPARNGTMGNHTDSKPGLKSLPTYLKALGYRVVLADKSDVRPKSVFDFEMLPATLPPRPDRNRRYRAEGLDTRAVDKFLAAHAREQPDRPLCLILGDNGPHVVWEANTTYDPAALPIPPIMVDTPQTRAALANYYQDITSVDRRVGEVLASLKSHGYEDQTLFIYASDQGAEWPHCKWTVYDTGLRVPFLVRWPGKVRAGAVCDALVSLVDVTPTFIDLAGGPPTRGLDGRSFKDVLLGHATKFRDAIYATHTGDGEMNRFPQRCVRGDRYKYVLNLNPEVTWTTHFTKVPGIPGSHKEVWDSWVEKAGNDRRAAALVDLIEHHPAEELYDTQADPYELDNRASDPALKPVIERMRGELMRWMAEQGEEEFNHGPHGKTRK